MLDGEDARLLRGGYAQLVIACAAGRREMRVRELSDYRTSPGTPAGEGATAPKS
jgi:hypothetical protein